MLALARKIAISCQPSLIRSRQNYVSINLTEYDEVDFTEYNEVVVGHKIKKVLFFQ